ncbi:hypothetical protein [Streptomyces sp. NPDC003697]
MTEATREGRIRLLVSQGRAGATAGRGVAPGPSTHDPAPARASAASAVAAAGGILTRGGPSVAVKVTEPLLRNFLDEMSVLEADLARRWVRSDAQSVFTGVE